MICQKRQKPEHTKEKLSDFGKYFLDTESGSGSWKKKQRTGTSSRVARHVSGIAGGICM